VFRFALPVLLTVLILSACAPLATRPVGPVVTRGFADELLRQWAATSSRVTSLRGIAKFQVQAPLKSLNGTQVLIVEKPDHLRAETLSAFGVPLLVLASNGERLGVSVPPENLFYTGAATAENLASFVKLPLPPAELVHLLLYQPELLQGYKEEAYTLPEGGWLLVRHGTLQRQELVFGPLRQLVEVSFFDHNDLILRVEYGQFSESGRGFPHRMSLEVPGRFTTVTLEFSDLETNAPLRSGLFQLTPPPGAKVVYLTNG
jgi:hypothetical protein